MRRRPNQLGQRLRSPIVWPCLAALGLFLAAQGCRRHDPATEKIQADDTANFFWWKRTVASQLNPEVQRHLEATLQEVRLDIMSRREASGHDAIEAALCRRLNRLSVNDALLLGGQLKWRRLFTEHTDLLSAIDTNALLVTKPGDRVAARELERIRGNQQQRLAALAAELSTAENEISQLGGDVSALRLALPAAPPEAISHAEALENVAGLLNGRRAAALLKYGG